MASDAMDVQRTPNVLSRETVDLSPQPVTSNSKKPFLSRKSKSLSSPELSAVDAAAAAAEVNVTLETEEANSLAASLWARARNRKKSRKMTLLQACAESTTTNNDGTAAAEISDPENSGKDQAPTAAAVAADGAICDPLKDRKISRIFQMLQNMQQAFVQPPVLTASADPVSGNASSSSSSGGGGGGKSAAAISASASTSSFPSASSQTCPNADNSPGVKAPPPTTGGGSVRVPAHLRSLRGLGQSQDCISYVDMPLRNPIRDRLARFGSINSWAGSEYSEASAASSGAAIPTSHMVHPIPYHKDGW